MGWGLLAGAPGAFRVLRGAIRLDHDGRTALHAGLKVFGLIGHMDRLRHRRDPGGVLALVLCPRYQGDAVKGVVRLLQLLEVGLVEREVRQGSSRSGLPLFFLLAQDHHPATGLAAGFRQFIGLQEAQLLNRCRVLKDDGPGRDDAETEREPEKTPGDYPCYDVCRVHDQFLSVSGRCRGLTYP